ncbi:hypothetical protein KC722_00180 [Candidatus Kaiserbacteria bacterium]|nr:hypothetical protein [Candidatus Kaiserbacteria bacterium]MCB9811326.1 hypothetical protein [Candidatus Nomurabacteria bacterium]
MAPRSKETLVDIVVHDLEIDGVGRYTMMSFSSPAHKEECITFAIELSEGVWIPGPFPQALLHDPDTLETVAEALAKDGYLLTKSPEQLSLFN